MVDLVRSGALSLAVLKTLPFERMGKGSASATTLFVQLFWTGLLATDLPQPTHGAGHDNHDVMGSTRDADTLADASAPLYDAVTRVARLQDLDAMKQGLLYFLQCHAPALRQLHQSGGFGGGKATALTEAGRRQRAHWFNDRLVHVRRLLERQPDRTHDFLQHPSLFD